MYDFLSAIREKHPLIHCITNPISINQCANAILAVGGAPIMAEHPREVEEIVSNADSLMLNLGNITDVRIESMKKAAAAAKGLIPIIIDAVGVACSSLRRAYAFELAAFSPTLIKGNYSEIKALYFERGSAHGVDSDGSSAVEELDEIALKLAKKYDAMILASGAVDIITDGERLIHIYNGTARLSALTGTGCILGALTAAVISVRVDIEAAAFSCALLGVCGELANEAVGQGAFQLELMDALSTIDTDRLEEHLKIKEIKIEI